MTADSKTRGDIVSALLLVLLAAVVSFVVLVELSRYLAVFFCSILAALALSAVARRLSFGRRVPHAASVGITVAVGLLLAGAAAWWIGPLLVEQFEELREQVPRGLDAARRWFEASALGRRVEANVPDLDAGLTNPKEVVQNTGRFLGASFAVMADFLIFLVVTIFLAVSPDRYTGGAIRLLPARHRDRGREVLGAAGKALRRWLLARGALMLLVAVLLGTGLLLIGVQLALPLALLAGLFSFVPYVGPALALAPALAIGLLQSPMHALYVAVLYLGVQMVESYVVEPMVEAKAISLPPALIIAAQVITSIWLGAVGVLIATPLLVVIVVMIQIVYQRGALGDEVSVIGSD